MTYLIPTAEDDRQIDFGPFHLKGWLLDRSHDRGIDDKDPWAGGIWHPAPRPSKDVIDAMNLVADSEQRNWRQIKTDPVAMLVETWGTFREKDDDTTEERGHRVHAPLSFVAELLRKFGMDMIVKVEIERRRSYSRYESHDEDDKKKIPPSTQLFLIKSAGRIRTV